MLKGIFDSLPFLGKKEKDGGAKVTDDKNKSDELEFEENDFGGLDDYDEVTKEMESASGEDDEFSELDLDEEAEKNRKEKPEKSAKAPVAGKKVFGLPLPVVGAVIALIFVLAVGFMILPALFEKKAPPPRPSASLAQKYEAMRRQAQMKKRQSPAQTTVSKTADTEKQKVTTLAQQEKQLTPPKKQKVQEEAKEKVSKTFGKPGKPVEAQQKKDIEVAVPPIVTTNIATPQPPTGGTKLAPVAPVAPPAVVAKNVPSEKQNVEQKVEAEKVSKSSVPAQTPQVKLVKPELEKKKQGYEAQKLRELASAEASFLYQPKQPKDSTKKEVSKIVDIIILNVAKRFYQDDLADLVDFSTLQRLSWEDLMKLKSSLKIFLELEKMRSELIASRLNELNAQLNFAKELQKLVEPEVKKTGNRSHRSVSNALITGIVGKGALGTETPKPRPVRTQTEKPKKEEKKEKKKPVIVRPLPEIEGIFDEGVIIQGQFIPVGGRYDTYRLQDVDFERKVARFVNEVNGVVIERSLAPFFVEEKKPQAQPVFGFPNSDMPPLPPHETL